MGLTIVTFLAMFRSKKICKYDFSFNVFIALSKYVLYLYYVRLAIKSLSDYILTFICFMFFITKFHNFNGKS